MKVIDLLNKIANGEAPENIRYKENEYYLFDSKSYLTNDKSRFFDTIYFKELNDEIEIVEEKPKKIEKIELDSEENIIYYEDGEKHRFNTNKQNKYFAHKIIELQKAVNYLLEKESDK